jgi:alcohol dehydrogenase class IV
MAPAFGIDTRGLTEAQAAERAVSAATRFITEMGIPKIGDAMAVTAADIPMLVKETVETTASPIAPEVARAVWERIFA